MNFFQFLWEQPIYILLIYLALINLATFIIFGIDKLKAKRQSWRIPEKTLIILCAICGSIGGLAGMYVFHHKTLHQRFTLGVPMILLAQVIVAGAILYLTK